MRAGDGLEGVVKGEDGPRVRGARRRTGRQREVARSADGAGGGGGPSKGPPRSSSPAEQLSSGEDQGVESGEGPAKELGFLPATEGAVSRERQGQSFQTKALAPGRTLLII